MGELYGQLKSEELATENTVARQIVKEVIDFGVNDRMLWLVIHGLVMNIENVSHMQELAGHIRDLRNDLFLIDRTV